MFEKFKKAVGAVTETVTETVTEGAKKVAGAVKDALIDTDVREEGLSGAEIYRIFTEGNARSLRTAADAWAKSGDKYDEAREALTAALRAAWPDWEGPAASAARAAMVPLEQSLAAARDAATRASTAIDTQADWFDRTQNKVHKLADNPPTDPGPAVAAMFHDLERKADAYHEKADANRQFYREYVDATRQNLGALPEFTPPLPLGQDNPASSMSASPVSGAVSPAAVSPGAWPGSTGSPQVSAQPVGAADDVVRPAGVAGTENRSGATTVAARSDSPGRGGWENGRFGNGVSGESGRSGNGLGGASGRFGSGQVAESGRGREPHGRAGRLAAAAQPAPGAPTPLGQNAKRDDEERSRRSHLPGPDPQQLFGLDEEPPPAVIGLRKGKS